MTTVSPIPLSDLGNSTGRFYLDEGWPLIVMRCWFDGSEGEDDGGAKWLTLAGYMASDEFWAAFQLKWERMLIERYPIAPYLHMWELLSHEKPFTRDNGWTDQKITDLVVNGAVHLLQSLDKKSFRAFVYSIDVSAHARLLEEGYEIGKPEIICAHSCIKASFTWYSNNHPIDQGYIFYDRGEHFFPAIRQEWLEHDIKKKDGPTGTFWDYIANVNEVNMETSPPIQAADLIAWARSRELSNRDRPYRYLAEVARAVIPNSFYKLDEEAMRRKYKKKTD